MDIVALDVHLAQDSPHGLTIVQHRVYDDTRRQRERDAVRDRIRRWEVQRRVVVKRFDVEGVVRTEDLRDIVRLAVSVVRDIGEDGEMCQVPDLAEARVNVNYIQLR